MKTDPKFDVSVRVLQEEKNELEELALKHDLSLDRITRWMIREGLRVVRQAKPLPAPVKREPSGVELVIQ
jgi:hypothetical protein